VEDLKSKISGYSIDDGKTIQTIKEVYEKYNHLLEPHSAVAYNALQQYLSENPGKKGIILGTAHPIKFPDALEKATHIKIELPESLENLINKEKKSIEIQPDFAELKRFLLYKN